MATEINRIQKNLIAELSAEVKVLDDEKLNKTALASMLGELIFDPTASNTTFIVKLPKVIRH